MIFFSLLVAALGLDAVSLVAGVAVSCESSVALCAAAPRAPASWCSCCDAAACDEAAVSAAANVSLPTCLAQGWCRVGGSGCAATPRCDAIRDALASRAPNATEPSTSGAIDVDATGDDDVGLTDATTSALFLVFVLALVCIAGVAITKVDLSSMGLH